MAPNIHPDKNIFFAFAGLIFPWLIGLNILFIITWILFEKKWAVLSIVLLVFSWSQCNKYFNLFRSSTISSEQNITISSFNLKQGYDIRGESSDKSDSFLNFLSQELESDIFAAQEVNKYVINLIASQKVFPYQHRIPGRGTIIYSKFPIVNSGQIDFNTKTNSCLWADIQSPYCTFRVYSFHLQSNNITKDANKVIDKGDLQDKETWSGVRKILGKYKRATRIRSTQAEMIQTHIKTCPHPVVLTGDMNDPPQSFVYNRISEGFTDSFLAKGFGLGTTFAGRIPSLRIDYIFADSNFEILEHRVIKKKFSDHFPIKAKIQCLVD
jgi:endonuclease/exonuclease/phosphatase family metal-dependent hydrolase